MSRPLLNILTRTSERPNRFKRCRESIDAQVWGGTVRHIVSIDKPCDYIQCADVVVPVHTGAKGPAIPREHIDYRDAPYNLYINDMLKAVKGGWVVVLDDDDELFGTDSLSAVEPYLEDEGNLIVTKFLLKDRVMPSYHGKQLVMNDVPCTSIIYHSRHKMHGEWHGKYAGDYFAAANLAKKLNIVWVDKVIAGTQVGPSFGKCQNTSYRAWKPRSVKAPRKGGDLVSIIIPVHNQSKFTKKIIPNIKETVHIPHEIIIVDDGSTDDTAEYLKTQDVTVITNSINKGVYAAWNQGCRAAKGDWFAILNNDLTLPDGWLETLLRHDQFVVCPSYQHTEKIPANWEKRNVVMSRRPPRLRETKKPGLFPSGFAGFCFMFAREVWESVGEFDEKRFRYWYGDNDFWIRVQGAGYKPLQSLNVEILHNHSQTVGTMPDFIPVREAERVRFEKKWEA